MASAQTNSPNEAQSTHCQEISIPLENAELKDIYPRFRKDSLYRFTGPFHKRVYPDCPAFYSKFLESTANSSINEDP